MIDVQNLTKRYDDVVAVDGLSFTVRPGIVTGFLGPNGAGKSTTMRMILGLDRPTSGTASVNGRPLHEHSAPLTQIGALLDAKAVHPKRSARDHLRTLAATTGISDRRVDDMLGLVGLDDVGGRPAGSFSLGMGQRLGIASALLGDPETVMLDEPVNGLDPEGILWIRALLRRLADDGRTVFVSSHLMTEMSMIAEHYVIVGRGHLIADVSASELEAMGRDQTVRVRTPQATELADALRAQGATIERIAGASDVLVVDRLDAERIGRTAADRRIVLFELTPQQSSLEDTFMELTRDSVQYSSRKAA
jgi:ABC-2 type transport system ATP-binding protein